MSGLNPSFYEEGQDSEDESTEEEPPEKIAKKVYKQQFRHQWLDDPEFKDWLVRKRLGVHRNSVPAG